MSRFRISSPRNNSLSVNNFSRLSSNRISRAMRDILMPRAIEYRTSSESSSIRRIVISEWPPVSLSRSCQFTSVTLSLVSSIIQTSGVSEASMKLENISAFGTARTGYLSRYKGIYSVYDAFYGLTAIYRHLNVSNRPGETV